MPGDPIPTTTPEAAPAATPAAPAYVTPDQLNSALGGLGRQIGAQFSNAIGQLATRLPAQAEERNAGANVEDKGRALLADPDAYFAKQWDDRYRQQVGALEAVRIPEAYASNVAALRTEMDAKFGPGAFDSEILPQVESTLEALPNGTVARASSSYVRSIAQMIQGQKFDALSQRAAAYTAQRTKEASVAPTAPMMMPFGLTPPTKSELTAAEREMVENSQRIAGAQWDLPTDLAMRDAMLNGEFDTARGYSVQKMREFLTRQGAKGAPK